jgi:hypothetical protein
VAYLGGGGEAGGALSVPKLRAGAEGRTGNPPSLDKNGHSSNGGGWSRQQKRVYHRTLTCLAYWEQQGFQGYWGTLTTAPGGRADQLSAHFEELRRRIERRTGYRGVEFFKVNTREGNGVIHCLLFWKPRSGEPWRQFYLDFRWLTDEWEKIHGARVNWWRPYRAGGGSRMRLSRYLVAQYVGNQEKGGESALVSMSWSWRRTFGFAMVKMWGRFKNTFEGPVLRVGLYRKWHQFLGGFTVFLLGSRESPFVSPVSLEIARGGG